MILAIVLVVGLAAHRAARALTTDTITDRFRSWVYRHAYTVAPFNPLPPGTTDEDEAKMVDPDWTPGGWETIRSKAWVWVYGLVSCPHCAGFWFSVGAYTLWVHQPDTQPYLIAVSVAGAQSVISAKGME